MLYKNKCTSFYPNGILKFKVCPKHLDPDAFWYVIRYTTETRTTAKHKAPEFLKIAESIPLDNPDRRLIETEANKLKVKADGLKIAINRMYGALKNVYDYLYDPKCTYQVTVNLQLCLLMLIERLELNDIEVISANTDGIVCKFKPEQEDIYNSICKEWEKELSFELEYTDYEKYLRNDVNNYIAIKKGFKDTINKLDNPTKDQLKSIEKKYIKRKGLFIEEVEFNKGYNSPVVSYALNKYFIYNINYIETIKNHINSSKEAIYDYCISQKSDNSFKIIYEYIENGIPGVEDLQKSNRFYVVKNSTRSGSIVKTKVSQRKKKGQLVQVTVKDRIVAGVSLQPFNNFIPKEDYDIDFGYYNRECSKILYGKNKKTEGIESTSYDLNFENNEQDLFSQELIEEDFDIPIDDDAVEMKPIFTDDGDLKF